MSIFPSEEHRAELLMRLKLLGIAVINVEFSGGGDSGSINDVIAKTPDDAEVDLEAQPTMSWIVETSAHNPVTRQWEKSYRPAHLSLKSILTKMTDQALEESGLDWYNNDGGQGELVISFYESPPAIQLNVGINYTKTDDYHFNFSGTGELEAVEEDDDASASSQPD